MGSSPRRRSNSISGSRGSGRLLKLREGIAPATDMQCGGFCMIEEQHEGKNTGSVYFSWTPTGSLSQVAVIQGSK